MLSCPRLSRAGDRRTRHALSTPTSCCRDPRVGGLNNVAKTDFGERKRGRGEEVLDVLGGGEGGGGGVEDDPLEASLRVVIDIDIDTGGSSASSRAKSIAGVTWNHPRARIYI